MIDASPLPAVWPLLGLVLAALAGSAALLAQPRWVARRRARLRGRPFPAAWRRILRQRVPLVARLPADLQQRLKGHIQVFLAEKPMLGCQGLRVSDEMRVTVAAQACMLLLGRAEPDYFPGLRQVLLYPGAFVVERLQPQGGGVLQEQRRALAGESWQQGQVILSWDDVRAGGAVADDGCNVVMHELAHQLDQDTGAANGAPAMASPAQARRWSQVMNAAFARLQAMTQAELPSVLSAYGASSAAEFFAVATEVFFEQPHQLVAEYPALYTELARYYLVDPLAW
ncbi:MAG: zinc-dependent peptidase [Burkholderiales bacterium]|nr:zinc-dependent peptidase [Burkholderiales bacterium]